MAAQKFILILKNGREVARSDESRRAAIAQLPISFRIAHEGTVELWEKGVRIAEDTCSYKIKEEGERDDNAFTIDEAYRDLYTTRAHKVLEDYGYEIFYAEKK
jgi:hypothetical protein